MTLFVQERSTQRDLVVVNRPLQLCPYLERRDPRCADFLTLTNLKQALGRCAGDHEYCAIYHQIRLGDLRHETHLPVAQSA